MYRQIFRGVDIRQISRSFPVLPAMAFVTLIVCSQSAECAVPSPRDAESPPAATRVATTPTYPHIIVTGGGSVSIHMPQIESWDGLQTMTAWTAVEARVVGEDQTWYASLKIKGKTDIDFDQRVVVVHDIHVSETVMADGDRPPDRIRDLVRQALSFEPRTVPLDTVLRALPDDFVADNRRPGPTTEYSPESPVIFVATEPAALMIIHGTPVLSPIPGLTLQFVTNTDWDLFRDEADGRWYVHNGPAWQTSDSLESSTWPPTRDLPADLEKLPEDGRWKNVRKWIPAPASGGKPPRLYVSLRPAELIHIDGRPQSEAMGNNGISWITNTASALFTYQDAYFCLLSGRWFTAPTLGTDWSVVDELPEAFASIPHDHPRAHVLAHVSGTDDARAATIDANLPRTATIRLDAAPDLEVTYTGDPEFKPIDGTGLQRAVNTAYQVIHAGESYYLCYNAVWFKSISPTGPWVVATEVPSEIYAIPATDPAHNVTYVYPVTESATTTVVTYAYLPGYYGVYASRGVVVYGTGYYYPPYYARDPWGYPDYGFYYPPSYGNDSWYNPATGTYRHRAVAHGSDSVAGTVTAYNPRTGAVGAGNLYYDFDDKEGWSERYVEQGDRWVHSKTEYDDGRSHSEYETARGITGESDRVREGDAITGSGTIQAGNRQGTTSSRIDREGAQVNVDGDRGGSADVTKEFGQSGREVTVTNPDGESVSKHTSRGDLYADRDGQIYRRDGNEWSRYSGNSNWQSTAGSAQSTRTSYSTSGQTNLDRQYHARSTGQQNYQTYQSQRSSLQGGSGGSMSLRGRGISRGGGRRR